MLGKSPGLKSEFITKSCLPSRELADELPKIRAMVHLTLSPLR